MLTGCSRTTITNWVKKAKEKLDEELKKFKTNYSQKADIIALDEIGIYAYVQKNKKSHRMIVYSRLQERVIAYHTGKGKPAAKEIYRKVKKLRPNISHVYTNASSCYDTAFSEMKIPENHHTMTKSKTHIG